LYRPPQVELRRNLCVTLTKAGYRQKRDQWQKPLHDSPPRNGAVASTPSGMEIDRRVTKEKPDFNACPWQTLRFRGSQIDWIVTMEIRKENKPEEDDRQVANLQNELQWEGSDQ